MQALPGFWESRQVVATGSREFGLDDEGLESAVTVVGLALLLHGEGARGSDVGHPVHVLGGVGGLVVVAVVFYADGAEVD